MKGQLQKELDETLKNVPRLLLSEMVEKKLASAGVRPHKKLVAKLTDAVMVGNAESINWDGEEGDGEVSINFTDDDLKELNESAQKFIESLPKIIGDLTRRSARSIIRTLKQNWPEQYAWEQQTVSEFQERLEARWGEALNLLRMLLTVSREIGSETHTKLARSRAKKNRHRADVLLRLHARACQVTGEIIILMESGYADGAMARWRTLHEISVVATLIADNDNDLAHRYMAHDFIESKRALDVYVRNYANLGYKPPAQREVKRVERDYNLILQEFGPEMVHDYGWAAKHLKKKKPTFSDLEAAAGKSRIRAHYKMACQNVHAGIKGITNQLGALPEAPVILAGASNAGLEEPGQNTAITLTQITFTLLAPSSQLDDVVAMSVLADLQIKAVNGFVRAGRRLKREAAAREKKKKPTKKK